MEDKSLERGVEKLAESILSEIETGPDGSYNHTKMLKVAEEVLKLYAKQENASLQDKLRVVEAENKKLKNRVSLLSASANRVRAAYDGGLNAELKSENTRLREAIENAVEIATDPGKEDPFGNQWQWFYRLKGTLALEGGK